MDDMIASGEGLAVHLEALRGRGGWPADFEVAARDLGTRLHRAMKWSTTLDLARVGIEVFRGPRAVPTDRPPVFEGRSQDDLASPGRVVTGAGPRREPLPDESMVAYVWYLCDELSAALVGQGIDETDDAQVAVAGYVQVLAHDSFRRVIGWERTLDAHALCALTGERALRLMGARAMAPEVEEACFRWLHEATYDEIPTSYVEEQARRREIRLAHERAPAGAVAVMTCEVSLVDALWYQEVMEKIAPGAFPPGMLRQIIDDLATSAKGPRHRWELRRQAFAEIGHLDLTERAESQGDDYDASVQGHLLRWMEDHELPVGPLQMAWAETYATLVVRLLVHDPIRRGKTHPPVMVHFWSMQVIRQRKGPVPLADELVMLAWLMDQRSFGIKLGPFLEERAKRLTTAE